MYCMQFLVTSFFFTLKYLNNSENYTYKQMYNIQSEPQYKRNFHSA